MLKVPPTMVSGRVRPHYVTPNIWTAYPGLPPGWCPLHTFQHNLLLFEWGAVVGNLLLRKGLQYGIGGMYIEFENVASPGDPVVQPTLTRDADQGVDYYAALAGSSNRDYVRAPLIAGVLDSSDETNYPKGNRATFFAQTSGVTGVHGKGFSDANNSTVYGGALVAFVVESDPTQDLVLCRFTFDTDKQTPKLATNEVGVEWGVTLK